MTFSLMVRAHPWGQRRASQALSGPAGPYLGCPVSRRIGIPADRQGSSDRGSMGGGSTGGDVLLSGVRFLAGEGPARPGLAQDASHPALPLMRIACKRPVIRLRCEPFSTSRCGGLSLARSPVTGSGLADVPSWSPPIGSAVVFS